MAEKNPFDHFMDEIEKLLQATREGLEKLSHQEISMEEEDIPQELLERFKNVQQAAAFFMQLNKAFIPTTEEAQAQLSSVLHETDQLPEEVRDKIIRSKRLQQDVEQVQREMIIETAQSSTKSKLKKKQKSNSKDRKKKFRRVDDDRWKRI